MRHLALAAPLLALVAAGCAKPSTAVNSAAVETAAPIAADRALALGKAGALSPAGLVVNVEVSDGYGHKRQEPALRFTWREDDLRRITWSGMTGYAALDLSHPEILTPNGARALGYWCIDPQKDRGRTLTPNLCQKPFEAAAAAFMTNPATQSP